MAKRKTRGRAKLMLLEADHRTIGLYHLNPTIEADEFLDHEDPPPLVVHHLNRVRKDDVGTVMAWSIELLKQAGLSAADVHCFRARADEIVGLARDGKRGESLVAAIDFGMRVQAALLAPLDDPATNTVRQKLGAPKGGQANAKRSRELAPSWQKKIDRLVLEKGHSYSSAMRIVASKGDTSYGSLRRWTRNPKPRK